jgi:SpoVK/Ycf46/Vps4 family AAA+-type ATPase
MYKQIYEKARIRLPRGILLFGPSGTGKSFIVPALAKKCGYPLIVCRGPELLSKYVGASESKVRELFARAFSVAPSILFFDELDALAPRRGTDSTGVTDRVVNQLLTFLDGVEETSSMSGTVYIIASSSRPDKIDPALLRPGRLERHVYVGICEHETELTDLILQTARRNHAASDVLDYIRSGQMVHDLSVKAPHAFNFTAADLNAVFHTAHVAAAHEALALGRDTKNALLCLEHVMSAFSATTPSLLNDEWTRLAKIYSSFRGIISQPSETSKNQESLKVALR